MTLDDGTAPTSAPIRVALVNDYEIVVEGLRQMLRPFADRVVVVEIVAGDTPDGVSDIALFDTFAGRRHALERVKEMLGDRDIGKVVLYTWDAPTKFLDDVTAMRIDGVILKSETGARLVEALERVHRGEPVGLDANDPSDAPTVLTEREREVLALIAKGASNREIARELYLSVDTVKTHVRTLFRKLEVPNRTRAALAADQFGLAAPGRR
jgi:two-component system, NarL family, response regulator LiaR